VDLNPQQHDNDLYSTMTETESKVVTRKSDPTKLYSAQQLVSSVG